MKLAINTGFLIVLIQTSLFGQEPWPISLPYPNDFPAWPDSRITIEPNSDFEKALTDGERLTATYTAESGNQIIYSFLDDPGGPPRANPEEITRSRTRTTKRNYANQNLVTTTIAGFWQQMDNTIYSAAVLQNNTGYGGVGLGEHSIWQTKYTYSYTLATNALGNIEATEVKQSSTARRVTTIGASDLNVVWSSAYTSKPTEQTPTLPDRKEVLGATFTDNVSTDQWTLERRFYVTLPVGEVSGLTVYNANLWPNSGGQGSEELSAFAATPILSHCFGDEYIHPASPAWYVCGMYQTDAPWGQEPW